MGRSRMFGDDKNQEEDRPDRANSRDEEDKIPSPRTTIVGGRPPDERAELPPIPTGIAQLVRLASVDDGFRALLVKKRGVAAQAAGVSLTASEEAILSAIPAFQLEQMCTQLPPPPAGRRDFLRQTAASAAVLLGGAALTACDRCNPMVTAGGAAPDMPPNRPEHREMESDAGAPRQLPPDDEAVPDESQAVDAQPESSRVDAPARHPGSDKGVAPGSPVVPSNEEPVPKRPKRPNTTRGIRPRN